VAEYTSELELLSEVVGAALEIVDSVLVGRVRLLSEALETEVDVG
jgi:hypothetical protein